jgi:hypothetical protein
MAQHIIDDKFKIEDALLLASDNMGNTHFPDNHSLRINDKSVFPPHHH